MKSSLEQLADLIGIETTYSDFWGEQKTVGEETLRELIIRMGYAASTDDEIEASLLALEESRWSNVLEPVIVIPAEQQNKHVLTIVLPEGSQNKILHCAITEEGGAQHHINIAVSNMRVEEEYWLKGRALCRYQFTFSWHLPVGYHTLSASFERTRSTIELGKTTLIVAPRRCLAPEELNSDKMWGLAAQLYSLRSDNNWGMGDFGDLKKLVQLAGKKGASSIGLNPLHPLYSGNPAHCSPYSPSSRSFLNTLYIDVAAAVEQAQCVPAQKLIKSTRFEQALSRLRLTDQVEYTEVAACKNQVLDCLFDDFCETQLGRNTPEDKAFKRFCREGGTALERLAVFETLYEHFRALDHTAYGWQDWPAAFHSPESEAVKTFATEHARRVSYFQYLQWIADSQLSAAAEQACESGMTLGLYLDLAVGCDGGSAEVWSNPELFVSGVSVGAPPDPLSLVGQNWGLTAMSPLALRDQAFMPFVRALRSNMRHAGALRIDHVIGLMRQYWVVPGQAADAGAFVRFPLEELLRIVALESRRANCIVIGEDLGTVPDGLRDLLSEAALQSYRVLYFERWESGLFKRPETYPSQSMVTVSTHDLPTFAGWWLGRDIDARETLALYPRESMNIEDRRARAADRDTLVAALIDAGVLTPERTPPQNPPQMTDELLVAAQRFLASSPGRLQLIPLEDALGVTEQVNMPGTVDQHPNWRHRLPVEVDELFEHKDLKQVLKAVVEERPSPESSVNPVNYEEDYLH